MVEQRYALCVIGAGTAGFAAAEVARARGASVVIVAGPGPLGGTCILRGCMPAKSLLSATERLGDVATAGNLGVDVTGGGIDLDAIVRRKRDLVDYFAEDRRSDLDRYPLVRGIARFVARDAIEIDGRRIAADAFVVATGSHVAPPEVPGLDAGAYFTSDGALEMTRPPRDIAVLGGGPVGCEFAQYFARLGKRVTLVQREPRLLRNEDDAVGEAIATALTGDGVDVRTSCETVACTRDGDDRILTLRDARGTHALRVGGIMLATGRVPNVASLDLAAAGVARDDAGIAVDATLRTSNPRVFAAGDVLGRRCLVHVAAYAGRLAACNALDGGARVADFDRYEAHAVYTQPQVAVAGATERALRAGGETIAIRRHPFSDVGKALVSDAATGFITMIADGSGRLRGVTIVAADAIDLIGEAIALIDRGATTRDVAAMPHLHPTLGEIFARVAEDFETPGAQPAPDAPESVGAGAPQA